MDLTTLHRFHIAPGGDPADASTWVWEDRSADVNAEDIVRITGGRRDEVVAVDVGTLSLQVDNAGGHWCTGNPMGRWYGRLASGGTPARWGTVSGAATFSVNATNGWGTPEVGTWSLSGAASNWSVSSGTGRRTFATANLASTATLVGADARNGDATFVCFIDVVATGGPMIYGMMVRRIDANNYLMFNVELSTSGSISAKIRRSVGGVQSQIAVNEPLAITYTANQRIKARCQWDGPNLRLKIWQEASAEPAAWTLTTTDTLIDGSGVAMYLWRFVANTNAGAMIAYIDDVEVEAVEIVGPLTALPVSWDPTATVSYTQIQVAGITRGLSQGQEAVRSPIYGMLSGKNPMAYWALEDGPLATTASSAMPRGLAADAIDVTFGSTDCPPGAASAAVLNTLDTSRIVGRVNPWTIAQDGYSSLIYTRLPALPPSATSVRMLEFIASGTITRWVVYINNAVFTLEGYNSAGVLTVAPISTIFVVDPTKWMAMQLKVDEVGGNFDWSLTWYKIGDPLFYQQAGTTAGTADRLHTVYAYAAVAGQLVTHLWAGDEDIPFIDTGFIAVSTGYAGETDVERVARLGLQAGVSTAVEAGTGRALGVQRAGTFLDQARAAEAGGLGILYEAGAAIGYRPLTTRYNRPVSLALSITGLDIGEPTPSVTDDDLRFRNHWTVTRDGGGSATDSDATSIALRGRKPDSTTISVQSDAVLLDHASWRVHMGVWPEMRWPQITLDLTDRPALLTWWRGRAYAPRITISGIPTQGPIGADLDLIVEGWSQEVTSHSWRVTLVCSPAKIWDIGIYDDTGSRYDSASTTLVGTQTTSSTSWAISTVDPLDVWSTTAVPYDWNAAGERVTVTAMTAAAGTGPYTQTATVTRSVNGIVKTHAALEPIGLYTPARYGL